MYFQYGKKFNKHANGSLFADVGAHLERGAPMRLPSAAQGQLPLASQLGVYRAACELIDSGAVEASTSIGEAALDLVKALGERGGHVLSERLDSAISVAKYQETRASIVWLAANGAGRSPLAGMSDMPEGSDCVEEAAKVGRRLGRGDLLAAASWSALAAKLDPTLRALEALEASGIAQDDRTRIFDKLPQWLPDHEDAAEQCAQCHPWVAAMLATGSPLAEALIEKWAPATAECRLIAWDALALKSADAESRQVEAVFKAFAREKVAIASHSCRQKVLERYASLLGQKEAAAKRAAKAIGAWLCAVPGQASDVEIVRLAAEGVSGASPSDFERLARTVAEIFALGGRWATAERPRGSRNQWREVADVISGEALELSAPFSERDARIRGACKSALAALAEVDVHLADREGLPKPAKMGRL